MWREKCEGKKRKKRILRVKTGSRQKGYSESTYMGLDRKRIFYVIRVSTQIESLHVPFQPWILVCTLCKLIY